jgi:uncharacterized protein (DUF1501 family)
MKEKNVSVITRRDFLRRAACAAVGTAAMTSTIRDLRFMNAALAQSSITNYKALVCIFLAGGNDSNNLIVPTVSSEYNNYAAIRTPVLALPQGNLLPLKKSDGVTDYADPDGHTFGFHPACPELQALFTAGKLAVMMNTGTLVMPITRAQYLSGGSRPPQLFSHADQVTQWQTSVPDQPALTGWGGRCADLLNSVNPSGEISLSVSLAGANTFEVGNIVSQYAVSTSGAISLNNVSGARLAALTNILGLPYPNMQAQAYSGVAEHTINTGALLNNAITNSASTNFWTNGFSSSITTPNGGNTFTSGLSQQLKMIARLIDAGNRATNGAPPGFGMKRQIFFCQVGGYDLHSGQTNFSNNNPGNVILGAHANLFAELSQSLKYFQSAMEQLGLQDQVTVFTASDFGRTFPSNGQGSDHGWGSHHLILGGSGGGVGSVLGGKTYGKFPTLTVNGPDDTGTGRWIPTTATDQYFATIASWFGVDSGNIPVVFPNIGRFATANLGFMNAP